ncbi:hypothetical protein QAD02_010847 [Eretmocerus hayati]|uniref:Uncharacterized protein n=2 Tax=Eretmocerus hayati TaxID=131215 RepID=A0ACC2NVC6_9HYME|nr:hypothetical protein QAD02_010845 [Eretmocerus hayati]KAJ8675061.1 hypothetical protein QAD02_010847 [Eretmocerus hayati]
MPSTETVIPTTTTSAPPPTTTVSPSIDYGKVENSYATGLVRDEPKKEPGCDVCEILRKIEDLQLKQESYYFEVMKKFEEMEMNRIADKVEIMMELKERPSPLKFIGLPMPRPTIPLPPLPSYLRGPSYPSFGQYLHSSSRGPWRSP